MSQFIEMFGDVIKNSNDWREYGPIGNYADIVLGSTPDSKNPQYWDGDICWVTPAELNDDVVVINDTVRHITNDGVSAANLTKLPKGSVLFSTRAPIGKVAVTGVEMYCNQGFKNFICGDKLNNLYLYYTLKLNRDYLCALGTGTTFKELSKKVVESISIAIPPIEMQNKFEDVFKQADKSKFVGFKSQFIEMFEDHNYTSVPLAELIDKSFPGEWGTEDENGNGTKVIRTTNITNSDKLDLSDVVTRNIVAAKLQKKQLCRGDILLERSGGTKDNPVGRVAYFNEDGVFVTNNFTQTLRCNNNIESRYLFYFLYYFYNLNKMKIRSMGNQTTGIQNLNMDDYMQISVIVPPRDLQKQFISIVTQADKSKYLN